MSGENKMQLDNGNRSTPHMSYPGEGMGPIDLTFNLKVCLGSNLELTDRGMKAGAARQITWSDIRRTCLGDNSAS